MLETHDEVFFVIKAPKIYRPC